MLTATTEFKILETPLFDTEEEKLARESRDKVKSILDKLFIS